MPAFAPVLRSEGLAAAVAGSDALVIDSLNDGDPVALAELLVTADVMLAVEALSDVLSRLAVAVDADADADADALVDTTTSLPTVAASVKNRELVLQ